MEKSAAGAAGAAGRERLEAEISAHRRAKEAAERARNEAIEAKIRRDIEDLRAGKQVGVKLRRIFAPRLGEVTDWQDLPVKVLSIAAIPLTARKEQVEEDEGMSGISYYYPALFTPGHGLLGRGM